MCLHDHDAVTTPPPSGLSRRGVLGGAALLAGIGAAGIGAAAPAGAAGHGASSGASGRVGSARPTVPAPLVVEGGSVVDPLTGHVVEDGVVVLRGGKVLAAGSRD